MVRASIVISRSLIPLFEKKKKKKRERERERERERARKWCSVQPLAHRSEGSFFLLLLLVFFPLKGLLCASWVWPTIVQKVGLSLVWNR